MITVSTGDLVGVLADVLAFALDDEELAELNSVRLEWDGEMLHAFAHDLGRTAWSQWHPDDPLPVGAQDDLFAQWGGADDAWSVGLRRADARELVRVFKLPAKERGCPLTVELRDGPRLRVARSAETSRSALISVVEHDNTPRFDVAAYLSQWDRVAPVRSIAFNAAQLADFAVPRARGPLRFTFTGEESPTLVEIGTRFIGAIMPTRTEPRISRDDRGRAAGAPGGAP